MSDNLPLLRGKKKSKGSLAYVAAIAVTLLILVLGIELVRRWKTPADAPTTLPAASDRAAQPFPRELHDAKGETVVITNRPQRIVSQTLGTDEILLAICPLERIAALSILAEDGNYSNMVEQAQQVSGRATEGAEQILQLKADLIFVASYSRAETVRLLQESKAPVFRFANFNSIADVISNIRTVGYATGCDAEAERLIQQMNDELAELRARVPQNQSPLRVMSYDRTGYTAGVNTLFDDVVRAAGAINASAEKGITGFAKISVEKIAEWQPDVIVGGANRGEIEKVRKQFLSNPVIAASRAGRAGRIIVIDNRRFLTVSQYVVREVEDLSNGLYGNRK
jgi:iron complex transport system substrate-binding protein